ncbi:MAG: ChaN family lipoprotein [Thermodesulfobacteriota bacterium]
MRAAAAFLGLILALAALVFSGCAPGLRVAGVEDLVEPDRIIELATGEALTPGELLERLARADVVFLGEYHQHALQHRNQLLLIEGLFMRRRELVVGLEMFSRPDQGLLDDWVAGRIGEEEFAERVVGPIINQETFEVYQPLLLWARQNRVPLLALNAPREITARVAREGLAGLSGPQRLGIAREVVLGPAPYKMRVARAFGHHQAVHDLDHFFAAQVVWDETMAETLADYLSSPEGRGRPAVVICGNEHVFHGWGVPGRVARRLAASQVLVLAPVTMDDETLGSGDADFIWVTAPQPPQKRLRLGIETAQGGLVVSRVSAHSEAERIGLRPGDRLLLLDGEEMGSLMDLHRAAVKGGAGVEHTLVVLRDGQRLTFHFRFREEEE